jgi:cell division septation protein DedD
LTTLFGTIEYKEVSEAPATPRKRFSWLPILTILFMISYALMTMLIFEQGQTIESQRVLIRELFRDSSELSAVKLKAQVEKNQTLAQNPSSQNPSTQAPSAQAPSIRVPMKQAPSSQAGPQQQAQNRAKAKPELQMPSKPAADLADHRRALITI